MRTTATIEDVASAPRGTLLVSDDGMFAWRKTGDRKTEWTRQKPHAVSVDGWAATDDGSSPRQFIAIQRALQYGQFSLVFPSKLNPSRTTRRAEGLVALFDSLIEESPPGSFPESVALVIDEKTALNGRPKRGRAYAASDESTVYIAPKLIDADADRQAGVLMHELAHVSLLQNGQADHTERDADALAHELWGRTIRYDADDVQTIEPGSGVSPRPKHLDSRGSDRPSTNPRRLSEWEKTQRERIKEKARNTYWGVFHWEVENRYRPASAIKIFRQRSAAQKFADASVENVVVRDVPAPEAEVGNMQVGTPAGDVAVVKTPGICGGSARLAGTRIPVWTLFALWRSGASDKEVLKAYPSLTERHVQEARRYVEDHEAELERDVREQEYTNENFPQPAVSELRRLGHDVAPVGGVEENPSNLVKTPRDERLWKAAKKSAAKQGRTGDWNYITGTFIRMRDRTGGARV